MGKPPGQSEGPYRSPNIDHEADMAAHGANPTLAKWIYVAAAIVCLVTFLLLMVGLHIPSGESP